MKSLFLFKTSEEEEEGAQGPDSVFIMCSWFGGLCMSACRTSHPSDLSLTVSLLMGCAFETHVDGGFWGKMLTEKIQNREIASC